MTTETRLKDGTVEFDKDTEFVVRLTGGQIGLLLQIVKAAHFRGSDAFAVFRTLEALETPLAEAAHGAIPDNGSPKPEGD